MKKLLFVLFIVIVTLSASGLAVSGKSDDAALEKIRNAFQFASPTNNSYVTKR